MTTTRGGPFAATTAGIALKRVEPGEDLITALVAARDGADRLSEDDLPVVAGRGVVLGGVEVAAGEIVLPVVLAVGPDALTWRLNFLMNGLTELPVRLGEPIG